jgi:hypothetical protein
VHVEEIALLDSLRFAGFFMSRMKLRQLQFDVVSRSEQQDKMMVQLIEVSLRTDGDFRIRYNESSIWYVGPFINHVWQKSAGSRSIVFRNFFHGETSKQ